MFDKIIDASVKFRAFIIIFTAAIASFGIFQLSKLPIDAVPDITNKQVRITTTASSLSPEQIEKQVTYPIETSLQGIVGLESTRSLSRNGFSQVTAVFKESTDIYFARNQVNERINQAKGSLPPDIEPQLAPITTGLGEVFMWTLDFMPPKSANEIKIGKAGWQNQNDYLTPEGELLSTPIQKATYLRTLQDWLVAPHMRSTKDVAGIDTIGGYVKEYVVTPDIAKMQSYNLGFDDLASALENANTQAGAGYIQKSGEALIVRADGKAQSINDLADAPIKPINGLILKIGDVANVAIGKAPRMGASTLNGHEVVIGTALMLTGANSRTVAQEARKKLDELEKSLPPNIIATPIMDRSILVNSTIKTVERNLLEGALLVIAVLFFALGNVRAAIITALMIPLSFLAAVIGMRYFNISGNLMSLGALDFGLLVDGAVVVIEGTLLALSQKAQRLGRSLSIAERIEAASHSAKAMVKPTLFGQLIIMLVYAPLLTLEGVEGKMFQPMAATVMLALLGAFIFSFTFIPAMVAIFVKEPKVDEKNHGEEHETFIIKRMRAVLDPAILWAINRPKQIFGIAIISLILGFGSFSMLGREFIPKLDEGDLAMVSLKIPSTSIEQSVEMQKGLEKAILKLPEVERYFAKTGTAEAATDPMPANVSDGVMILKPRKVWPNPSLSKEELIKKVEATANKQLGMNFEISQPIELRFNELISGVRADLAIKVYGEDFATISKTANEISKVLNSIEGSADLRVEQIGGQQTLVANVDRLTASAYGIPASEVTESVATAIGGRDVGQIFEGDKRFSVSIRLGENERNNPEILSSMPLPTPSGQSINLGSVAKLNLVDSPNQISRDSGSRRIVVQANIRGRDLGGFVTEAKKQVGEKVQLPTGVRLEWGGQIENLQRAEARLKIVIPVVGILIFLLLFMALGSMAEAAVVFACVPLALVGGALTLLLRGMPFSISAAVGFIAVSGVATLNGLVLMQSIRQKLESGLEPQKAVIEGVSSRLRAVLTTALVAIVGFIPMAIAHGSGAEVQKPLATVVIGGLISATILTLIVLPTFVAKTLRRS